MKIYFKKNFIRQYKKLQKTNREKVDKALRLFEENPQNPILKNHGLMGKLSGKRSMSAGFDLRIIFEVEENYITVIIIGVGTHNQVY